MLGQSGEEKKTWKRGSREKKFYGELGPEVSVVKMKLKAQKKKAEQGG